ncbi:trypsin-like peptidase domain-containing protein [bacterium]|nr:trypsin-like peptidase domain-containing protein [bacterium]
MNCRNKHLLFVLTNLIIFGAIGFSACSRKSKIESELFTESPINHKVVQTVSNPQIIDNMMQDQITQSRQNALTRAIADVSEAVVGISVAKPRKLRYDPFWDLYFETQEASNSLGSGFLISGDGYILTNEHVVGENGEITITTTDGVKHKAVRVGQDQKYDVALLKVDGGNFHYISLGNSEDIIIGEWAIALGNPFGLFDISAKPTVTVGVISATQMDFRRAFEGRSYSEMIQTDAAINGGNSGGPLVNSFGQAIGINTFIFTGNSYSQGSVGIGFAIPINRVKLILPALKNIGHIDRSFKTGLEVKNISRLVARMKRININDGVIVTRISKGSPAEKAGLKREDIIVKIGEYRIHSAREAQTVINNIDVTEDESLEIWIYRDGKIKQKTLKIAQDQI